MEVRLPYFWYNSCMAKLNLGDSSTGGDIYHVYNRGVEKRKIFLQERDYIRFIHDMFEFNDLAPAANTNYYSNLSKSNFHRLERKPRKLLVEILCFCLMPNHYHFLLKEKISGGITEFMRKIGTGYTNYFNTKYDRVGPLFQGKFKAAHITEQAHLLYMPHYIHLNPLGIKMGEWRDRKIRNVTAALKFLSSYRWSSYPDFIGKVNFPSVTQRDFLYKIYRSRTSIDYEADVKEWLEDFDFAPLEGVMID